MNAKTVSGCPYAEKCKKTDKNRTVPDQSGINFHASGK